MGKSWFEKIKNELVHSPKFKNIWIAFKKKKQMIQNLRQSAINSFTFIFSHRRILASVTIHHQNWSEYLHFIWKIFFKFFIFIIGHTVFFDLCQKVTNIKVLRIRRLFVGNFVLHKYTHINKFTKFSLFDLIKHLNIFSKTKKTSAD